MRLLYLAGLLDALEVVLPLFSDAVPRGLFVSLNLLVIPGAMVARVVAQRAFKARSRCARPPCPPPSGARGR